MTEPKQTALGENEGSACLAVHLVKLLVGQKIIPVNTLDGLGSQGIQAIDARKRRCF